MLFHARFKKERVRVKTLSYLFAIPMLSFICGIINPAIATAEEITLQDQGGTGTFINASSSSASLGGDLQTSSSSSTQGQSAEVAPVAATTGSRVVQVAVQ